MSRDELYGFFKEQPVHKWFNPNAPKIKNGFINPYALTQNEAIELLLDEPILIKRPLMIVNQHLISGFDKKEWELVLDIPVSAGRLNSCSSHDETCVPDNRNVS